MVNFGLSINKRVASIWDMILFVLLSSLGFYVCDNLMGATSSFSVLSYDLFFKDYLYLHFFSFFTLISIIFLMKWSRYIFLINTLLLSIEIASWLTVDLNKIVLIYLFFYIIISYFFYLTWGNILKLSCYNSFYDESEIDPLYDYSYNATIQGFTNELDAVLTNWDELGCFLKVEDNARVRTGLIRIDLRIKDEIFKVSGRIVSKYKTTGIGVVFDEDHQEWHDFIILSDQRGLRPFNLIG